MQKERVIIFTRVPEPGKVKTRLLGALSPRQCADLHAAFLADTVRAVQASGREAVVWYAPSDDISPLLRVTGALRVEEQRGDTLGARMAEAFKAELASCEAAAITGSDLPRLTARHIDGVFALLSEKKDVVLSPSGDGGYSIIGMKIPYHEPFEILGYGGSSVLKSTLDAITGAGLHYALADRCDDVDTPEDLSSLCEELLAGKTDAPNTAAWLRAAGILQERSGA